MEGEHVEISIALPDRVIRSKAEVVRVFNPKDKGAQARIRFAEMTTKDKGYLREYLSFLREQQRESALSIRSKKLDNEEREKRVLMQTLLDKVGDPLAAIRFHLQRRLDHLARELPPPDPPLEDIISMMQNVMESVRKISSDLHPLILDHLGILATIHWLCREFETNHSGIRIEEETTIEESEIPEPLKIVVFRVVQEAFDRIAKHRDAELVRISLEKAGDAIQVSISDHGQGLDAQEVEGIKRRVEASGGTFSLDTTKGTAMRATWTL
jgi:signal transduction histidine kinase